MTKQALRQTFLSRRKVLSIDEVYHRSQSIALLFFDYLSQLDASPSLIHVFLPIQRQNEVDTWFIIRLLWTQFSHSQLAASVTDTMTNQLRHYPLTPTTPLVENRWGISEPIASGASAIESRQIDIVLVPLLAFDKQGHRVGYGKGFYDRFLVDCRPDCQKIGLSLFEPVNRIDNVEPTDVRLTTCFTPQQTYTFS